MFSADLGGYTTPLPAATNPAWANVQLLLHFEGANGSTTFTDSSSNAQTITSTGNSQINTSIFKYGTGSGSFDGTGDYLTLSTPISLAGDFTIEYWVYATQNESDGYTNALSGSGQIGYSNTGALIIYDNGWVLNNTGSGFAKNMWNHVAYTRSGTTVRGFVNGILSGSGSTSKTISISRIGAFSGGGFEVDGYLDEIRVCTECLYTSSFQPPTSVFPNS